VTTARAADLTSCNIWDTSHTSYALAAIRR